MNKLPVAGRLQILATLCEGWSMRSISRVADVSINTVSKLLGEGRAKEAAERSDDHAAPRSLPVRQATGEDRDPAVRRRTGTPG